MRAVLIAILLTAVLWAHFYFLVDSLPGGFWVHYIGAPAVVGAVAYATFRGAPGALLWLIWLPFLAPIVTVAAMEGDPAKPGLQWILYGPLLIGMYLGEGIAWGVDSMLHRGSNNEGAQA